ncbi:MAG: TetR/AcrR family transcriptional regulator [Ignavibacteria bacterium]|nr:TetR/AcrR family transcriptional regulator [Ignavibacteria bacterium]
MKTEDQRRQILEATLLLMEETEKHNITVRMVAQKANVNVAAINYYFGNKEALMDEALDLTLVNLFSDMEEMIPLVENNPAAVLKSFFMYIIEGTLRYPNITRSHLYEVVYNRNLQTKFAKGFGALLNKMAERISLHYGDPEQIKIRLICAFNGVLLSGLMPEFYKESCTFDLHDQVTKEKLADAALASMHLREMLPGNKN